MIWWEEKQSKWKPDVHVESTEIITLKSITNWSFPVNLVVEVDFETCSHTFLGRGLIFSYGNPDWKSYERTLVLLHNFRVPKGEVWDMKKYLPRIFLFDFDRDIYFIFITFL